MTITLIAVGIIVLAIITAINKAINAKSEQEEDYIFNVTANQGETSTNTNYQPKTPKQSTMEHNSPVNHTEHGTLYITSKGKMIPLSDPQHRPMNDDDMDDFIAIDFETMTALRTSACAIGMVKVIDGHVVQKFYSLINPIRDDKTDRQPNLAIHGIPLCEAEKAPTFAQLFDGIKAFIGSYPLVAHNKQIEVSILNALMDYYQLSGIRTDNTICTYQLTGKSLSDCCRQYNIPEVNHHDALWDAETCAALYLTLQGKQIVDHRVDSIGWQMQRDARIIDRKIDRKYITQLSDALIENKNTPFYNARVVITGEFDTYSRNDLAQKIQSLGAKITTSISSKTDIVLVGTDAGPRKLQQIDTFRDAGHPIRTITEQQLLDILQ